MQRNNNDKLLTYLADAAESMKFVELKANLKVTATILDPTINFFIAALTLEINAMWFGCSFQRLKYILIFIDLLFLRL